MPPPFCELACIHKSRTKNWFHWKRKEIGQWDWFTPSHASPTYLLKILVKYPSAMSCSPLSGLFQLSALVFVFQDVLMLPACDFTKDFSPFSAESWEVWRVSSSTSRYQSVIGGCFNNIHDWVLLEADVAPEQRLYPGWDWWVCEEARAAFPITTCWLNRSQ